MVSGEKCCLKSGLFVKLVVRKASLLGNVVFNGMGLLNFYANVSLAYWMEFMFFVEYF